MRYCSERQSQVSGGLAEPKGTWRERALRGCSSAALGQKEGGHKLWNEGEERIIDTL